MKARRLCEQLQEKHLGPAVKSQSAAVKNKRSNKLDKAHHDFTRPRPERRVFFFP